MSSGGEEGVTCSSCLVVPVGPCSPELSDPLPTLCRMHSCVRDGEQALKTYRGAAGDKQPAGAVQGLLGAVFVHEAVSKMGGTGFVGVGRCPAGTDGSEIAAWYLSKYSYRGLAPVSGQQGELDMLSAHTNKEAVKYFVIFFF